MAKIEKKWKSKLMQKSYKMAIKTIQPKRITKRRNAVDVYDNVKGIKKNLDLEILEKVAISQINEWLLKNAINKLADEYPTNVSNKNSKIWRPFEI